MADPFRTGVDNNLTGQLLVATPQLDGTRFARTVVWMFEHTHHSGAQGLIINRASDVPVATALRTPEAADLSNQTIYLGGPVNARGIYLLHTPEWYSQNTQLAGQYSVTSDSQMIERMSWMGEPIYWKMCVGCSSWSNEQLKDEIAQGLWLTAGATDQILFEQADDTMWMRAVEASAAQVFDCYI